MTMPHRATRFFALLVSALLLAAPAAQAQQIEPLPLAAPQTLKPDDPWLYRGTDIPQDEGWLFGELDNGLRYAVRENRVPGEQISVRVRIDAGSLHEEETERGYAHLIEHLAFRESKFLGEGEAIPTWQRLGARLGADTNAITSPTQTVFKLDLPQADGAKLERSMMLLSGMIREPALSDANIAAEVPIVLAERRESNGPARRLSDATHALFYKGQRLATRTPGGTVEALQNATGEGLRAFHDRWYRPENTVIAVVGDGPPELFAALIERYFADWDVAGDPVPAPDFGAPKPPAGAPLSAAPANPVGDAAILVEPDLPRGITWAVLRPWSKPVDNLEYNRLLMLDRVAQRIINARLEERARAGGSYVLADLERIEVGRSVNGTFVYITPLGDDWKAALRDVRAVIADALASPPGEDEIAREVAEIDVAFANMYDQRINQPGTRLADELVGAVDIREAVASPETFLTVFRGMHDRFTSEAVFERTKMLFEGDVSRIFMLTPDASEASEEDLRLALLEPVEADGSSRFAAQDISFADMPPIGEPAQPVMRGEIGLFDIEQVDYANGVKALVWRTENEPGRVTVRVRFGSGYRGFSESDAPYIGLGRMALVASGIGPLGETEIDAIATGRKLGFEFAIEDGVFRFEAQTRKEDVADQLWLFAAKLGLPRWDERPVERAKALALLSYDSAAADPMSVMNRDLDWLLNDRDARFSVAPPSELEAATPEGFRRVWEPLLAQGPVELMVFGDIDTEATVEAISRTFGALPAREPIPDAALARAMHFPAQQDMPLVLFHHGSADQAAAVVAWPLGGGIEGVPVSRELEVLGEVFTNRLLAALREQAGASYTPFVTSSWPADIDSGGRMMAIAQVEPEMVPQFFAMADAIAADLAATGPDEDELERVTEPFRQVLNRVINGHIFWMNAIEGATGDPRRIAQLGSLLDDYTQTTPERMRQLAGEYLAGRKGWRMAVIPKGQVLAAAPAAVDGAHSTNR